MLPLNVTDCFIGMFHKVIVLLEYINSMTYKSTAIVYLICWHYAWCFSGAHYAKNCAGVISLGLVSVVVVYNAIILKYTVRVYVMVYCH